MPDLLILKMGSTLPGLMRRKGDFTDWILAGLGLNSGEARVVNVCGEEALPAYAGARGVVISGSHSMVTDQHGWSERAALWLAGAVNWGIPILGICYGHQLLARALGGEVGYNPRGREIGTVEVAIQNGAHDDPLLGDLPVRFQAHACHAQTVLRLPSGARRLAASARDANQAYAVGGCAWGVQFHPEFDAAALRAYLRHERAALLAEGQDPDALLAEVVDAPAAARILRRFGEIVRDQGIRGKGE
jgi:GMP synthase (glutamine-hydrolysing)